MAIRDIAEYRGARRNSQVETMAYAGDVPWHLAGTSVGEAQTSEVMIVKAGVDWDVELGPVYGPGQLEIPGWNSIYRVTDKKVFAVSKGRYEVWNNRDAFAFTDSLVADGIAKYETAGSLYGGAKVWVLMKLDQGMQIGNEEYRNYVMVLNGFDLQTSITVKYVNERVVCRNTAWIALAEQSLTFRTTHAPGIDRRMTQAHEMFRVTTEAQRRMQILLEQMQEVKLTKKDRQVVQDELFGTLDEETPTRRKNAIEAFQAIYEAERQLNGHSAYTMFNAATGYADHAAVYRGTGVEREESRLRSMIDGPNAKLKAKTLEVLRDIAPVLEKVG